MANLFLGTQIADFGGPNTAYVEGDVTEVADPLGSGQTVIKMEVPDDHTAEVTSDPRAQLASPDLIEDGDEVWVAAEVLIPTGHPTITSWMVVVEFYGPPFGGTGALVHAEASFDRCINWERSGTYSFDEPTHGVSPWPRNQWVQVVYHLKHAEAGWVELWINGEQVTFFKPGNSYNPKSLPETTKLEMKTVESGVNDEGPNHVKIAYYREAGQYEVGAIYHKGLSIATTKEDLNLAALEGSEGEEPGEAVAAAYPLSFTTDGVTTLLGV